MSIKSLAKSWFAWSKSAPSASDASTAAATAQAPVVDEFKRQREPPPSRPTAVAPPPGPTAVPNDAAALRRQLNLQQQLQVLRSVSRSVSDDFRHGIKPGSNWGVDAQGNIVYKAADLEQKSDDYALGAILGQVGLRQFSRRPDSPMFAEGGNGRLLYNAMEGLRSKTLQVAQLPGAKAFFRTVYQEDILAKTPETQRAELERSMVSVQLGRGVQQAEAERKAKEVATGMTCPLPRHQQYVLGIIHDWCTDGQPPPAWLDPQVVQKLQATRQDYRDACSPQRDSSVQPLTPDEIDAQHRRAEQITLNKLLPVYDEFLRQDEQEMARMLSLPAGSGQQSAQKAEAGGEASQQPKSIAKDSRVDTVPPLTSGGGGGALLARIRSKSPAERYAAAVYYDYDNNTWHIAPSHRSSVSPLQGAAWNPGPQWNVFPAAVDGTPPLTFQPGNVDTVELVLAADMHLPADAVLVAAKASRLEDYAGTLSGQPGREYLVARDASLANKPAPVGDELKCALKVPGKMAGYIKPLALEACAGETTASGRASAIESFLKKNYKYECGVQFHSDDHVREFLLEKTPAHCEFFATSMVMMLRSLDIPARYVVGFMPGGRNKKEDAYLIREPGHAWVEAYIPERGGWVTYEPTPPSGLPQGDGNNDEEEAAGQNGQADGKEQPEQPTDGAGKDDKAKDDKAKDDKATEEKPREPVEPMPMEEADPSQPPAETTQEQKEMIREALRKLDDELNDSVDNKLERDAEAFQKENEAPAELPDSTKDESQPFSGSTAPACDPNTRSRPKPTEEQLLSQHRETQNLIADMRSPYEAYYAMLAPYVSDLVGELRNILERNADMQYIGDFRSGTKLNMTRAMQSAAKYEMTGQFDDKNWLRAQDPTERDFTFVLIVDESGSMKTRGGKKWDNMIKGLITAAEALEELHIKFAVIGVSDKPKIHKTFDDNYDVAFREQMLADIQRAPNNGNDEDGFDTALSMMAPIPSEQFRCIISLGDGGLNSEQETALRVRLALARSQQIKAIGGGIGPGMEKIGKVFPDSFFVERVQDLAFVLADRLRDEIAGAFA